MGTNPAWKKRERSISRIFGGKRNGATGHRDNDIDHPLFAIEVKYRKELPRWALDCLNQAKGARNASDKIPMAILIGRYMRVTDGLVVMRCQDFQDLCGRIDSGEEIKIGGTD